MSWRDLLFAHWRVTPETVSRRLPAGLEVDTYDGDAYLGIVPFCMADIRLRGAPIGLRFGGVNFRTYVTAKSAETANRGSNPTEHDPSNKPEGGSAVYFFSIDADESLGSTIARRLLRFPYYRADIDIEADGEGDDREVRFRSRRRTKAADPARFEATYGPGDDFTEPDPKSLAAFLTERYRLYITDGGGRLYYADIVHDPWALASARADVKDETLFDANGFEKPNGDPIVHFGVPMDVTSDRIRRV